MPLESLLQKWPCHCASFMHQQLRLNAVHPGGLLQSVNDVREKLALDLIRVAWLLAVVNEQITNDALTSLVHEERVTEDASTINRCIPWQDLGIEIGRASCRERMSI